MWVWKLKRGDSSAAARSLSLGPPVRQAAARSAAARLLRRGSGTQHTVAGAASTAGGPECRAARRVAGGARTSSAAWSRTWSRACGRGLGSRWPALGLCVRAAAKTPRPNAYSAEPLRPLSASRRAAAAVAVARSPLAADSRRTADFLLCLPSGVTQVRLCSPTRSQAPSGCTSVPSPHRLERPRCVGRALAPANDTRSEGQVRYARQRQVRSGQAELHPAQALAVRRAIRSFFVVLLHPTRWSRITSRPRRLAPFPQHTPLIAPSLPNLNPGLAS